MSALKVVAPLALAFSAVGLLLLVWLIRSLLPRSWHRAGRWLAAMILAPIALGAVLLLMSGPGALNMLIAKLLVT